MSEHARPEINWLKGVALPAGLALMECCWLYPWAVLLGHWLRPGGLTPLLAAPAVFLLLLLGGAAARAAERLRLPEPAVRALLVGGGLLAVLLVVRLDYYAAAPPADLGWLVDLGRAVANMLGEMDTPPLAAAFGLALWGRGLSQAGGTLGVEEIADHFRFGLVALIVALLALATTAPPAQAVLLASAGPAALAFIPVVLATRSLARLADVRAQAQARTGAALGVDQEWLGMLLGLVGGLFLLTLLLAQVFAIDLLAPIVAGILWLVGTVLGLAIMIVALPIGLLLGSLVPWLQSLIGQRPPRPQEGNEPARLDDLQESMERLNLPPEWALIAQYLITVLLIVAGLRALARLIVRRRRQERAEDVVEERESLWYWGLLVEALRTWLAGLRARFSPQPAPAATAADLPAAAHPVESAPVLTIRGLYRRLLGMGVMAGVTRAAGATPFEHEPRLATRLGPAEDVAWLTAAYVETRYGPTPPPAAVLEEARARLEHIAAHDPEAAGREEGPAGG